MPVTEEDFNKMTFDELVELCESKKEEGRLEPKYSIPQVTLDNNRLQDPIHIRNTYIRYGYDVLKEYECEHCGKECSYNKRIQSLVRQWFTSPQNIERIITDNTDK